MRHEVYFHMTKPQKPLPISWLIMYLQGTDFSHCCLEMSHHGRSIVYDSKGLQNNIQASFLFWRVNKVVRTYRVIVTEEEYDLIFDRLLRRAGTPYGWKQILGMAWQVIVRRLTGKRIPNPAANDYAASVCSEELARIAVEDIQAFNLDLPSYDSADLAWIEGKIKQNGRFTRMC